MTCEACKFLSGLDRRISRSFGEDRETYFLFQRVSLSLFRFNSILLLDSFVLDVADDRSEQ